VAVTHCDTLQWLLCNRLSFAVLLMTWLSRWVSRFSGCVAHDHRTVSSLIVSHWWHASIAISEYDHISCIVAKSLVLMTRAIECASCLFKPGFVGSWPHEWVCPKCCKDVLLVPHYTSHVTLVPSTSRCGQACVCVYSLLFIMTYDFLSSHSGPSCSRRAGGCCNRMPYPSQICVVFLSCYFPCRVDT
jgi:hypothetical protein